MFAALTKSGIGQIAAKFKVISRKNKYLCNVYVLNQLMWECFHYPNNNHFLVHHFIVVFLPSQSYISYKNSFKVEGVCFPIWKINEINFIKRTVPLLKCKIALDSWVLTDFESEVRFSGGKNDVLENCAYDLYWGRIGHID